MFGRKPAPVKKKQQSSAAPARVSAVLLECLEDRRLLSGSHGFREFGGAFGLGGFDGGRHGATITFAQAPTAVQSGLTSLAATDNVTAPTSSQTVFLGNRNGVETYTVDLTGTGTQTQLTVDQAGNAVTAPTFTTTTFGAVSNSAVTDAITRIAAALNLAAPVSTTEVAVSTPAAGAGGTATYSVSLAPSTSTTTTTTEGYFEHGAGSPSTRAAIRSATSGSRSAPCPPRSGTA